MSETKETSIENGTTDPSPEALNTDWYWRGIRLKYYRAPLTQVALVGLIACMTVGMSIALAGTGGGGLLNTHQSTNANVAIYSTFAALAFFAGTIYNKIGIRLCLMFGGFGYALLASAYMAAAHLDNKATSYIVIAGCVEGLCAAILWTVQGTVTMSYPTEDMKGRAFSLFWTIFRAGGVIGSIIPICLNWDTAAGNMSDGTYIAFIVIILSGAMVLPWLLLPSDRIIRSDGTRVVLPELPTWRSEIMGMIEAITEDQWIITLFPFFIASNWFYTYQMNDFNAPNFTLRTRSFNGLWANFFEIIGVWVMGISLDWKPERYGRPLRAKAGLVFLLVATMTIWGGGWILVRHSIRGIIPDPLIDLTQTKRYIPYLTIAMFWSFYDGAFQAYAYWLMGSLSNNSRRLSHYSGWYKSLQSAAAAVVWRLDGLKISYTSMYLSTWMIMVFALITASYVASTKVQPHTYDEPRNHTIGYSDNDGAIPISKEDSSTEAVLAATI